MKIIYPKDSDLLESPFKDSLLEILKNGKTPRILKHNLPSDFRKLIYGEK